MKNNNNNGVNALKREDYNLTIEAKKKYHKTDRAFWQHPFIIIFMTLSFSVLDALVLYAILDIAMTQAEYMGKIMAFGIALILNVIPLLTAMFVQQLIYKTKRLAGLWTVISIFAFVILFAGTVLLRFAYDDIYDTSDRTTLENTVVNDEFAQSNGDEHSSGNKSLAIVLLLCIEPLVTSIVNFALAFSNDDELRKKMKFLEILVLEQDEKISDCQAALATMDNDQAKKLELDETNLLCSKESVIAKGETMMAIARSMLAEYIAEPSATSKLSSEKLDNEMKLEEKKQIEVSVDDIYSEPILNLVD